MSIDKPIVARNRKPFMTADERSEWKRGLLPAAAIAIAWGSGAQLIIQVGGTMVRPVMEATGWSTTEVLLAPLITTIFALMGPIIGRIIGRLGVRRTAITGLIGMAVVYAFLATLPLTHFIYYTAAVLLGVLGSFAYIVPINKAMSLWFDKGVGKSFAMLGVGGSVISLIMVPVTATLVQQFGYQAGFVLLGASILILSLPAILFATSRRRGQTLEDLVRAAELDAPPTVAVGRKLTLGQVLRKPILWVLGLVMALLAGALSGIYQNLQPMLIDSGIDPTAAASVASTFFIGSLLGRLVSGIMLDRINRYVVGIILFGIVALGVIPLVFVGGIPLVGIVAITILIGFGYGSDADFNAYVTLREFGRRNFAFVFGILNLIMIVGVFGGPYIFAAIRDSSGSYSTAMIVAIGMILLAVLIMPIIARTLAAKDAVQPNPTEASSNA